METIKPGQFVELTYDLFVGSENELMESATAEAPFQFVFGVDQMLPSFESHIKDLKVGDTYFSQIGDLTIQSYNKENSRIKFTQINSREIAKQFTNLILYTTQDFTKEHCKLKEDEFFWFEIIGSKILESEEVLGEVCEIERFGQKDFLSIKTSHDLQAKGFPKSFLVPYEKRYIKEVDIHTTPKIIHTNFCKEILENS